MRESSMRSSTLLATLFTFCPPGPPLRTAFTRMAAAGTRSFPGMQRSSAMSG